MCQIHYIHFLLYFSEVINIFLVDALIIGAVPIILLLLLDYPYVFRPQLYSHLHYSLYHNNLLP